MERSSGASRAVRCMSTDAKAYRTADPSAEATTMPPRTVVSSLVEGSRVLVVSASMGGGHDGAGRELVRRLQARGHEAHMVDYHRAFPLRAGWLVRVGYNLELRLAPWSYEATYRLWYLFPFVFAPLGAFINLMTGRRVRRWVRESRADVVISTYPMASLVLGRA